MKTKPCWKQSRLAHKPKFPVATVQFADGKTVHGQAVNVTETHITVLYGKKKYGTFPRSMVTLFNHPAKGGDSNGE